jgi:hypothetical protein
MRIDTAIEFLQKTHVFDGQPEDLVKWHNHEDSLGFLANTVDDDIPVYVTGAHFYIYSVVVPLDRLVGDYRGSLAKWSMTASSGYGYGYSLSGQSREFFLSEPIEHAGTDILKGAMPIYFSRSFSGDEKLRFYVEINQRISHVFGLHWQETKQAWCSLDDAGAIISVARWRHDERIHYCTFRRRELDAFLYLTKSCLIRVFDVTRQTTAKDFPGRNRSDSEFKDDTSEIYARRGIFGPSGTPTFSFVRGFQIVRCARSNAEMEMQLTDSEPREFASFLIQDWKHHTIREWSSDPAQLGNYFVESDLPFETSPAFFKPDVLLHCRQHPERYKVGDRRIECRGAWTLQYDVNVEGQVHAFICDLGRLPFEEQLRWKSFNEKPRAPISERSLKTDFHGIWDDSYDPLRALKQVMESFPKQDKHGRPTPIWSLLKAPPGKGIDFLGYVLTESRKEWEDQILALAQVLVEGLNASYINKLSERYGARDPKLAAGKQLSKLLEALGVTADEVSKITSPLAEVWGLRSTIVAHQGGKLPDGDLRVHFRGLLERADTAMQRLVEIVQSGLLEGPVEA